MSNNKILRVAVVLGILGGLFYCIKPLYSIDLGKETQPIQVMPFAICVILTGVLLSLMAYPILKKHLASKREGSQLGSDHTKGF